jgi:hypothetical protein
LNISLDLINAILGYLGTKPYAEVAQLINSIQSEAAKSVEQPNPQDIKDA